MTAKYPKIESNAQMLAMFLEWDFVPSDPFVDGVKWVDAICQKSGKTIKISLERLRKRQINHDCCEPPKTKKKFQFSIDPYPPYVNSGSCI
jgi:hypothetical protein